jgi:Ca2+-binding RTX toxin-like protein
VVDCGDGFDRAVIRPPDVAEGCERVRAINPQNEPGPRGQVIKGTRGDDTLTGGEGRDFILGRAGNDTLSGLGGNDFLFGMHGNDTLDGGLGNDRAWGGPENDTISGGDGDDWLFAGWGADVVSGGAGNDRVWSGASDAAADAIDCGEGDRDRAVLRPGDTAVGCEHVKTLT